MKGAGMADDDLTEEDTQPAVNLPPLVSLPPPPEISFTRPKLSQERPAPRQAFSSSAPGSAGQTPLSQGVQGYGLAITAAITLAITLLVFVALGQWLDHRFGHGGVPWFTILGLLIGISAGLYNMVRLLNTAGRKK